MPQLDVFQNTLLKSEEWLREIREALEWEDDHRAYTALRAVLHTLRDRLPVVQAAHLGAQLPMLLRGLYYEGWTPLDKPIKFGREEFLLSVAGHFRAGIAIDPETVVKTVLDVMAVHIDPMESAKVAGLFPKEFADLFPVVASAR
jgi:uncharacterized protein (DUF2267 family)